MYICICHAVREGDYARYNLIGTTCGKCLSDKKTTDMKRNYRELTTRRERNEDNICTTYSGAGRVY